MKKHFHLKGLDEVNVWMDATPIEAFMSEYFIHEEIPVPSTSAEPRFKRVVIELKQPRGPRCLYGLLGVEIAESLQPFLKISVGDSKSDDRLFAESNLSVMETPRYGIPDGAVVPIVEALKNEFVNEKLIFCGHINVCFGAHSDISSNIIIFRKLAKAIPYLLITEDVDVDFLMDCLA